MLLPAWARAAQRVPDLHLCLAGADAGTLENVRRLIRDLQLESRVTVVGYLQGQDKLDALVDCDFLVLPSRFDLFPNVLCEAWVCGKPVVITDRCGIADVVAEQGLGLVAPFDSNQFSDCIIRLATDPQEAAAMGERGKRHVETELSSSQIAERHEALYASVLAAQRREGLPLRQSP